MKRPFVLRLLILLLMAVAAGICGQAIAIPITDPDLIDVSGLVSLGEDGAAWLRIGNQEVLVSAGYILSKDLRVTAVRHQGVVLYQEQSRKYTVLAPQIPDIRHHHHGQAVVWCMPMPLWKVVRMAALAYGKDYICHFETRAEVNPRQHASNLEMLMEVCVSPNHRYYRRDKTLYVSPVHVRQTDWTWFNKQVKRYKSERLLNWFPILERKTTLISDGRDLGNVLRSVETKTGVPIVWERPIPLPVYCSFKDRPWHQILENIMIYNGLSLYPGNGCLVVTQGWE